ncbi:SusC/RagA family TonB-linked outer membrane protein [Leeuwenhoekiella polynyae]|uniref:TonB-linked SusC/RagA family outer membrane protein n=1 Tax=Leeuwenhoekiella polynyae TaxID=1550906 RepID=A0A4V1KQD2_9FLAO|nr:SusC/RagA family TonB-linked outer membrane protein [Leeuwenhoekiella polynyae]RXG21002.1 TonB-linked SusC/RagA family outer membrane protein [Leeuwenhoekiella polynyae]
MKNKTTRLTGAALPGLICLLMSLSALWASASPLQSRVTGSVTDTNDNPIPGVSISLKNSNTGTQTDMDGSFELLASPQDTLRISYIGFKTLLLPVGNQTTFNIILQQDITDLGEVIINAGYYNTTRREQTGSIARVTAEEIERQPVTNPLAALQGRMAGVNITQTTGVPGGSFDIQIRGVNSLRAQANKPLYIIDGVPYASETLGYNQTYGSILPGDGLSPLNSINPADIKSIEILKDADATAIYGSRGANGVVLITTKTGSPGKTRFQARLQSGISYVGRTTQMLNTPQFLQMREEAYANDGIAIPANAYDINGTWDRDRYTHWQEVFIGRQAETLNAQVSVSGGSAQTRFLLSGGYQRQGTVFPGDYTYGRGSVHLNLNHQSTDERFRINLSTTYTSDQNNLPQSDLIRLAYQLAPNAPELYDEVGNLNWENSTWNNPLASLERAYEVQTQTLIANSVISYRLFDALTAKVNLGYTTSKVDEQVTNPSTAIDPAFGRGSEFSSLRTNDASSHSWIVEPQLNYQAVWGNHELDVLVGGSFQDQQRQQLGIYAFGFASNSLITNAAAASTLRITNNDVREYRYVAAFGRINYQLNSKYLLNLTARRDGSSRFGPGKQFANFGAVGLAWIFSEERGVKDKMGFLNFGKLRGSYGITGSDAIGDYQYLNTYTSTGTSYDGQTTLEPTRLFNPNFSWETNKKLELALELGMFNDRIRSTVAFYRNRSGNQLVGIPLPGTTGFSNLQANLDALVENKGWELSLNTVNLDNKAFRWESGINLTIPKTTLKSFPDLEGSTYANQYVVGEPLNIVKVFEFTQVNPESGIYEFTDFNEDDSVSFADDRQAVVSLDPKYFGGFSNSFSYKGWELNVLLQFVKQTGLDAVYQNAIPGGGANQHTGVLERWQQEGDLSRVQRYASGRVLAPALGFAYARSSTLAYSDASFVRLKNLALNYTFPKQFFRKLQCTLSVQGQNLAVWTPYTGNDPENQSVLSLPPLTTLTTGITLSF